MSDVVAQHGGGLEGLASVVWTIERWRDRGDRGRLAELRRLRTGSMPGEAFFSLADQIGAGVRYEHFLRRYLPLVASTRHRTGRPAGLVMREAGVAAARFERWLRAPSDRAVEEAASLVRRCPAVDLVRLGHQLYRWTDDDRLALAREYHRVRRASSHSTTTTNVSPE